MKKMYTLVQSRTNRRFAQLFRNPVRRLAVALLLLVLVGAVAKSSAQTGGCPTPSFSLKGAYPSQGDEPNFLAIGDLNGDGLSDAVVANFSTRNIAVLLNTGSGALAAPVLYAVPGATLAVTIADLNGDGKADIAAGYISGNFYDVNNIAIFFNNGDATFTQAGTYSTGSDSRLSSVTAADVNGDGKADLVTANNDRNNISVLLNQGTGTFAGAALYPSGGAGPLSIAVADFNQDGKLDLGIVNFFSRTITTLLNAGSGAFTTGGSYPSGSGQPYSITAADFNGDGKLDVATANNSSSNISVLLGNGDGSFNAAMLYASGGTYPLSLTTADFNGNGKPDLAVSNFSSDNVVVLLGKGDGSFGTAYTFSTGGTGATIVATGTFNNDGKPDLAVLNYNESTVGVLLNTCNPDSDGDGIPDAYDCEPYNKKVAKYLVCHKGKTLCVDKTGMQDHLKHGDKLGQCNNTITSATVQRNSIRSMPEQTLVAAGVYPNPTTGAFTLQLQNAKSELAQVLILDSKASVVQQKQVALTQGIQTLSFNLQGKAGGFYLVQLKNGEGMQTFKVYLQR